MLLPVITLPSVGWTSTVGRHKAVVCVRSMYESHDNSSERSWRATVSGEISTKLWALGRQWRQYYIARNCNFPFNYPYQSQATSEFECRPSFVLYQISVSSPGSSGEAFLVCFFPLI